MSEQTANPESTAPDADGAEAVDTSSEIEMLDESLSDMTSALLGEAGDDDIDFEGMFAEIEPAGRTTPAAADDAPASADPADPAEGGEASVSEQLDEIEAAVAAAIDDADAELDAPELETPEPDAAEPEAPEPEDTAAPEDRDPPSPTAAPEPDAEPEAAAEPEAEAEREAEAATEPESEPETEAADTAQPAASDAGTPTTPEGEAEAAEASGADPDNSMAAVAQDLEKSEDAPEAVADPSNPSPPEAAEAPPEPVAADPEAAVDEPDAVEPVETAAEPVEPEADAAEQESAEAAAPPESSAGATDAETAPEVQSDQFVTESTMAAAGAAPDHGDAPSSEDTGGSADVARTPAEPQKAPGGRKLPAGVAALVARIGPVVGRLAKPVFDQMGGHVAKGAEAVARSFTGQPKLIRHSVAWIALWTLFNAGVVWAYLGLFRSGSPTPTEGSGTQITGAAGAPESVIGAGAAGVPGMPTAPSGR